MGFPAFLVWGVGHTATACQEKPEGQPGKGPCGRRALGESVWKQAMESNSRKVKPSKPEFNPPVTSHLDFQLNEPHGFNQTCMQASTM